MEPNETHLTKTQLEKLIVLFPLKSILVNNIYVSLFKLHDPMIHYKGQRRYGHLHDWKGEILRGSEVHVSKLPRNMLEYEILPIFRRIGKIFEIRLMMETPEINKGFAFVRYYYKEDSEMAIKELNNFEIRPNIRINVRRSVDNNRLFIGNIPKNYQTEDIFQEMKKISEGIVKIILYSSVHDRSKNRGYGFVEFETHQEAKNARIKFKSSTLVWLGQEVKADWAEPEMEVDEQIMKKVRILYVRNLALCTTDQQLRDLFSKFGPVERVKKIKDYAFIHFSTREQAEYAKIDLQGYILDKCELDISWSKPVTNRDEYHQRKAASRALASGGSSPAAPLIHATVGLNGEPIIINQKVRTAAGAQGYITTRPYPLRIPKHNEDSHCPLQPSVIFPALPYLQDAIGVRSPLDPVNIASGIPQTLLTAERPNSTEDYILSADVQYPIAQVSPHLVQRCFSSIISAPTYTAMVPTPTISNGWGAQPILPHGTAPPTFMTSTYFVPSPAYPTIPGTLNAQGFFGGQMTNEIANIAASNMSIDRA